MLQLFKTNKKIHCLCKTVYYCSTKKCTYNIRRSEVKVKKKHNLYELRSKSFERANLCFGERSRVRMIMVMFMYIWTFAYCETRFSCARFHEAYQLAPIVRAWVSLRKQRK